MGDETTKIGDIVEILTGEITVEGDGEIMEEGEGDSSTLIIDGETITVRARGMITVTRRRGRNTGGRNPMKKIEQKGKRKEQQNATNKGRTTRENQLRITTRRKRRTTKGKRKQKVRLAKTGKEDSR